MKEIEIGSLYKGRRSGRMYLVLDVRNALVLACHWKTGSSCLAAVSDIYFKFNFKKL